MSIESLVFIGIVLFVWLIASLGSWLREQIEQYSRYQEERSALQEFSPAPDSGRVQPTAERPETPCSNLVVQESLKRPVRVRYRSRSTARQGIVLMTVFGSCKALERRDESRPMSG